MTVKGRITIACDEINVAGGMGELRCGDLTTLVPHGAMLFDGYRCAVRAFRAAAREGETDSRAFSRADDNSGRA